MQSSPLVTSRYTSISDRRKEVDVVRRELKAIIDAQPTQIRPEDREGYIKALIDDLKDDEASTWLSWPDDIYLLALTALKSLSRNPVGSTGLAGSKSLETLIHHTGLSSPAPSPSSSVAPSIPESAPALEALRVLANVLVLHSEGRENLAALDGGRLIARSLANSNEEVGTALLFLLGRVGFLVTVQRSDVVRDMVDKDGLVGSLVYFMLAIPLVPANYDTLSEVLKLVGNVLRFYPYPASGEPDPWDDKLDPLLWPLLYLLHSLPQVNPTPPLSHVLHALLLVPFSSSLLSTWRSIPEPPSPTPSSSSVRALLNKVKLSSPPRKSTSISDTPGGSFIRNKSPSPSPPSIPPSPPVLRKRPITLPGRKTFPAALPARVLRVFEGFVDTYYPFPRGWDEEVKGLKVDEILPPILLLLVRIAQGCMEFRTWLRDNLLPKNLDRSKEAGPLESRRGVLGDLLRLMQCATHPSSRDTAGELLWAICDSNPSTLNKEIGYGNAAGLLFRKGISGPPQATIEELSPDPDPHPDSDREEEEEDQEQDRNPITALKASREGDDLQNMSDAEKEKEAERLFVLFDRMDKNPIISAKTGQGSNAKSVKEAIRDEMERKAGNKEDEQEEEEEEEEQEEMRRKEEEDEQEALRDLEAYRRRKSGK
ncbi:guanine nucleotide exchange factor synembryn-domain-containing protein [Naematelia encephala]|uniref:Guanine nucleotide exchange factor synembryn-domain-containing protein n=1 Tax=Naematelia encephala TaxID=71784 RepID=A0A1Y2BAT2_9TREE|nr:guanine nucleotide exchange factor synembryn-domain-containing protein [Naematelia encephala]